MHKTIAGFAGVIALAAPAALAAPVHATGSAPGSTQTWVMNSQTVAGADHPVRIVAVGPIQGSGLLTQVEEETESGEVVHATWHLVGGTVAVDAVEDYNLDFDATSCTAKATSSGIWTIVGGTGAYSSASGEGTFSGHATLAGDRDDRGHCQGPESGVEPKVAISQLRGVGSVDLS